MKTTTSFSFGIAISLALIVPSEAEVEQQPLAFPKENSCDLPTDREMAACTADAAKAWDKSLNAEYQAALNRVTEKQRPLFVKAQRLWIQYRDANSRA